VGLSVYTTPLLDHRPVANQAPVILDGENPSLGIGVSGLPATNPEKGQVGRNVQLQLYG
jgi:hypothetical protein